MTTGSLTKRAISAHEKALADLENLQREMARTEKMESAFRQNIHVGPVLQQEFPVAGDAIAVFVRANWPTILQAEVERREKAVADTSEALTSALEADRRQRDLQAQRRKTSTEGEQE